jgi:hypothetical protein
MTAIYLSQNENIDEGQGDKLVFFDGSTKGSSYKADVMHFNSD